MAIISGDLTDLGHAPFEYKPIGQAVIIRKGDQLIGSGQIDEDHHFEIEIPDDIEGELELEVHVAGAARIFFEADGDTALQVMITHGGSNYLA